MRTFAAGNLIASNPYRPDLIPLPRLLPLTDRRPGKSASGRNTDGRSKPNHDGSGCGGGAYSLEGGPCQRRVQTILGWSRVW